MYFLLDCSTFYQSDTILYSLSICSFCNVIIQFTTLHLYTCKYHSGCCTSVVVIITFKYALGIESSDFLFEDPIGVWFVLTRVVVLYV